MQLRLQTISASAAFLNAIKATAAIASFGDQHKPRDQVLTRASGLTWFAIFNACRRGHFGMLRPKITARARAPPRFSPANIAIAVSRHFYFREAKKSDATQIAPRHRASSCCARSDEK